MSDRNPFRFSLQSFNTDSPANWRALIAKTEDLGYSTFFLADHFLSSRCGSSSKSVLVDAVRATAHFVWWFVGDSRLAWDSPRCRVELDGSIRALSVHPPPAVHWVLSFSHWQCDQLANHSDASNSPCVMLDIPPGYTENWRSLRNRKL